MKVKDHRQMMRSLTDPLNIPKLRALLEAHPVLTQEEFKARQSYKPGGLVEPGVTHYGKKKGPKSKAYLRSPLYKKIQEANKKGLVYDRITKKMRDPEPRPPKTLGLKMQQLEAYLASLPDDVIFGEGGVPSKRALSKKYLAQEGGGWINDAIKRVNRDFNKNLPLKSVQTLKTESALKILRELPEGSTINSTLIARQVDDSVPSSSTYDPTSIDDFLEKKEFKAKKFKIISMLDYNKSLPTYLGGKELKKLWKENPGLTDEQFFDQHLRGKTTNMGKPWTARNFTMLRIQDWKIKTSKPPLAKRQLPHARINPLHWGRDTVWNDLFETAFLNQTRKILPGAKTVILQKPLKDLSKIKTNLSKKVRGLSLIDNATGEILTYENFAEFLDKNKPGGLTYDQTLAEFEKRQLINTDPILKKQLAPKLQISTMRGLSHIHHLEGRSKNAYSVAFAPAAENMQEGQLKRSFDTAWANNTKSPLSVKKEIVRKYNEGLNQLKNIQTRLRPKGPLKGSPLDLVEFLKTNLGKKFSKLPPKVINKMAVVLRCPVGELGKAEGGRISFAAGSDPIGCITSKLEADPKGTLSKILDGVPEMRTPLAQTLGPDGWKFLGIDYDAAVKTKGPVASILRSVAKAAPKTTGALGSVSRFLFGPVEMGVLPLALAGDALYQNYANKRDLQKVLDEIPLSGEYGMPQYQKDLIMEGYIQQARDKGGVGLETYAIDQPLISHDSYVDKKGQLQMSPLEKIGFGDPNFLAQKAGESIAGKREEERQAYEAERERQRKIFDIDAPMMAKGGRASYLDGGIVSLLKK